MDRLLSVSRAARLVGTTRGALQKRIRNGELTSFEGQVRLSDLGELYPDVQLEDESMLEKVEQIIERAFQQVRTGKTTAPDMRTLATRVTELSNELADARFEVSNYNILFEKLKSKLTKLEQSDSSEVVDVVTNMKTWLHDEFSRLPTFVNRHDSLLARDTFLRIVAAQVQIIPSGHDFFLQGSENILDAGLSAGLALDYGCSNGACGKCKARLVSGEIKKIRNHDYVLTEAEKLAGYFLACSNTAVTDIVLEANEAHNENEIPQQRITAKIRKIEFPNQDIAILNVKTPRTQRLRFLAGQSVNLHLKGLEARNLPIASCPCDDMNLQFHVPRGTDEDLSDYIFDTAKSAESVTIEGPTGHFVLHEEDTHRPLIFIAYDTGFAPIKSLIEHALTRESSELVHLYWMAPRQHGHYLGNVCRAWADAFEHFHYTALDTDDTNGLGHETVDNMFDTIITDHDDLSYFDVFIAGPDRPITLLENNLLKRGVDASQIFRQIA
jgi:CDP-4-dehydro-6-deoxyglucose reductase